MNKWIQALSDVVETYIQLDTQGKFSLLLGLAAVVERETGKLPEEDLALFEQELSKILTNYISRLN